MGIPVTSTTLLCGLAARDGEAWSRLNRFYGGYLKAITRSRLARYGCFDSADIADIVQETFIAIVDATDRYDPSRARLRSFIRGVHHKKVADFLRACARRMEPLPDDLAVPAEADEPDARRALHRGFLAEALRELRASRIQRRSLRIFTRVRLRGRRIGDCAAEFAVPADVAYRGLHTCKVLLHRRVRFLSGEFESMS